MKRTTVTETVTVSETFRCGLKSCAMCERIAAARREADALRLENLRRANARVMNEVHRLYAEKRCDKNKFVFNREGETKCPSCKIEHYAATHLLSGDAYRCFGCGTIALAVVR